jgi:hypothetical protein
MHEIDDAGRRLDRRARLGGRLVAVAVLAGLIAATAASAVGGVFSVGSVIPGGEPSGPPENRQTADETVLATGTSPIAGPWRMTAYESQGTVENGEVIEPAGLPCIRLMLSEPPAGTPFAGRGHCGERGSGGFDVAGLPVRDAGGRSEILLFGRTPESTSWVDVAGEGGRRLRAQLHEGPSNLSGDVWVVAAPPDLERPRVTRSDGNGRAARTLDAAHEFDGLPRRP